MRALCQECRPRLLGNTDLLGGGEPGLGLATAANGINCDRRDREEHAHREQCDPPVVGRDQRDEQCPGGQHLKPHRERGATRCPQAATASTTATVSSEVTAHGHGSELEWGRLSAAVVTAAVSSVHQAVRGRPGARTTGAARATVSTIAGP